MTFWDHLDVLRSSLIRMACAVVLCAAVAFVLKEQLFAVTCSRCTLRVTTTVSVFAGSRVRMGQMLCSE